MLNQVAAALKTAMDERSIESLEAAIPKAEAYGIDTKAAKKLLKVRGFAMWRGCADTTIKSTTVPGTALHGP